MAHAVRSDSHRTTVAQGGRLVLPRLFREKLGLTPGALVEMKVEGSTLVVRPLPKERKPSPFVAYISRRENRLDLGIRNFEEAERLCDETWNEESLK